MWVDMGRKEKEKGRGGRRNPLTGCYYLI